MKRKNEINRVKELIDNDRFSIKNDFKGLVEKDLKKMLFEYFELITLPEIFIEKNNSCLEVTILFKSSRVKNFGTLPEEEIAL